jgi:hypothetical protein
MVAQRSLQKMWLVIVSTGLLYLYSYLYSQILFFAPNCHLQQNHRVFNWNANIYFFITDILWVWPLVYIFWPSNRTWYLK